MTTDEPQLAAGPPDRQVRAALAREFGLTCERLAPLAGGFIHRVWRAETSVGARAVKLYAGSDWPPARVAPTLRAQSHAAQHGLPVPGVYLTRGGGWLAPVRGNGLAAAGEHRLAVFDFAPGRHLDPGRLTPAIAAGIATVLARLHDSLAALPTGSVATPPAIPDPARIRGQCEDLLARARASTAADELDRLAAEVAEYRLAALARHPIDPDEYEAMTWQVVHGDFYPANLLFDGDGNVTAILDWDFCGPRWREIEVARAAVEAALTSDGEIDPARVRAFIEAYAPLRPLTRRQRRGMFRLWLHYLLASFYPLADAYLHRAGGSAGASPGLPREWQALARRRHRMLVLLAEHLNWL